jgi:Uncharacterized protein conserved in bacteria
MHADKSKVNRLLKTARGQIEGILKMIEEDRYCIDISNQLLATTAILKKVNQEVLSAHLHHCVKSSMDQDNINEKLKELDKVIKKL